MTDKDRLREAEKLIKILCMETAQSCEYCKHMVPCMGKECDMYQEGEGLYDEHNNYFDWEWSCMDFKYGTCDKMKDTVCSKCLADNDSGFEWHGSCEYKS